MPPFRVSNDSVRCCCQTRRSCWMSSLFIQCWFQWFGLTGVVVVHWSCAGGGWPKKKHFLCFQVPGVDIVMDYYWMVQHPTDQYTHLKVQEIHSCMRFLFLSHPRVFSAHDFVKLPPFRNSYPGSHGTHTSPFPTTVLAFVLVAK